jgi:hypothetical protein
MKRILLLLGLVLTDVSTLIASDDVSRSILQNVATGIHQIRLPDGKSLFGDTTAVMEAGCFDLDHLDDDTTSVFRAFSHFITILRNPIKTHGWVRTEYYTAAEAINYFQQIIEGAGHFNISALHVLWHFLRDGNIHGVQLPGLNPQPKRAALFRELYEWRNGWRADADHALEAIRLERERLELEAIAAEEAAARTTAEGARLEAVRKTQESGLRHRKTHDSTPTNADPEATVKDPLMSRKVK